MWLKNCFTITQITKSRTLSTISSTSKSVHENLQSSYTYGQPVHSTHPHLIKEDELVPGIRLEEFQQRRMRLMHDIQQYAVDCVNKQYVDKQHVVIIPSSCKKYMSNIIPYVFRQNSDFYYLTGCLEPDSVLTINTNAQNKIKSTLFMRPKDKYAEMWEGARTGVDLSVELFGVDEAYSMDKFGDVLMKLIQSENPCIWYDARNSDLKKVNEETARAMNYSKGHIRQLLTPTSVIHRMRLIKSLSEQNLMRRTCQIASEAINDVMKTTKVGHSEHHIFAMVDYQCRMRNANYLAYPPVVASGNNATTIHYISNTQLTKNDELVLIDAGCEYGGYTSDITRTWPVNGQFTEHQKILYEVVLQLQKELIDTLLQEGGQTLDQLFETMCIKLAKYLQDIGLVSKHLNNTSILGRVGYEFCPHHVSHYLGMDVHDTPSMSRSLKLLPGMVCTVEPGIYIPKNRMDVPQEFRGLGIRIEDDILIESENQIEILTKNCLKELDEIEKMAKLC